MRVEVCVCGHTREHHVYGIGACETVYPVWQCGSGCAVFRLRFTEG